MKTDRVAHDSRRVKVTLEELNSEKDNGDPKWVRPVAPLKGGDKNSGNPADHDADVGDHRENDDEHADERREIETEEGEGAANKTAIHQTNEELSAKIGDDVVIDL